MTSPERMKILEMIGSGQITAEEGARLLDASGSAALKAEAAPAPASAKRYEEKLEVMEPAKFKGRRLRIKVVETNGSKVNVNLPLSLMEVGLKIGGRFVDELNGLDAEMQMLFDAIQNDVQGKIVEVDDEDSHVEIYIE